MESGLLRGSWSGSYVTHGELPLGEGDAPVGPHSAGMVSLMTLRVMTFYKEAV